MRRSAFLLIIHGTVVWTYILILRVDCEKTLNERDFSTYISLPNVAAQHTCSVTRNPVQQSLSLKINSELITSEMGNFEFSVWEQLIRVNLINLEYVHLVHLRAWVKAVVSGALYMLFYDVCCHHLLKFSLSQLFSCNLTGARYGSLTIWKRGQTQLVCHLLFLNWVGFVKLLLCVSWRKP